MNSQSSAQIADSVPVGESCNFGRRVSMSNSRIAEAADMAFHGENSSGDIPENPLLAQSSRISLRKRKANSGAPLMVSCNSAFLSGIFADIAQANAVSESCSGEVSFSDGFADESSEKNPAEADDLVQSPQKKSRISLTKSLSRSAKSYHSLAAAVASENKGEDQPSSLQKDEPETTAPIPKHNSLEFQLNCVSQESGLEVTTLKNPLTDEDYSDILAFPHLPATVSSSSCSSDYLTRATSAGLQASALENSSNNIVSGDDKESYGWFVVTDDDDHSLTNPLDSSYRSSEASQLAFKAPTAPKQVDYDAEVEWAKAADTVDDVLADFF